MKGSFWEAGDGMTRPDLLLVGTYGTRSVPNVENEQLCFFLKKKTAPV